MTNSMELTSREKTAVKNVVATAKQNKDMNRKKKNQETAGERHYENQNKSNSISGVFPGSLPREESTRKGGTEAAENKEVILVNNEVTAPPVVIREESH